jgi:glutathione S-transferase
MQYFAAKGACSFGGHVVIRELDLPIPVTLVGLGEAGTLIRQVNPLGRVPALQLDDGSLLTENSAILPFLADQKPGTDLFAPAGSIDRARIQSWIGYINSEVHAASLRAINRPLRYSADPAALDGIRQAGLALLHAAFAPLDAHLAGRDYLVGDRFTIADAYLGLFTAYVDRLGEDFSAFQALARYREAYEARPTVQAARAFEEQHAAA